MLRLQKLLRRYQSCKLPWRQRGRGAPVGALIGACRDRVEVVVVRNQKRRIGQGKNTGQAAQPAQPAPVARPEPGPQTPAERLQHLARSLGADDEVLNDPYLFVQQETGHILCAACNKHLTAAHTQSKKHTGYLSNIDATLQWIRIERPDWLCLQILEMNGPFARAPTRTAREASKSGPPPGPSGEFGPSARNPGDAVDLPMPTDEEIFHFLMALSGRKWCCWDARWFSTEDPQPTRYPGRPEINQPDPSGGQPAGRFGKPRPVRQPAEEEQEIEEV
mmetsp:Transcript_3211/g.5415  ORF Transcript_3211/g.5415 Transcript_3211/m.5415 type:complete len:277 (+) Transcript_3211:181-1011(+)